MDAEKVEIKQILPLSFKVAASYMIIAGIFGLFLFLLDFNTNYPEAENYNTAQKLGMNFRNLLINGLFLASGIGLFFRKSWARKTALTILVISLIYTANDFAWGFVGGKPSVEVYIGSILVVGFWNCIWFYLIFRNKKTSLQENG